MHSTNYREALILPSPDCGAVTASVPGKPGTVAKMQYERLAEDPYSLTSDELLFGIHAERNGIEDTDRAEARARFFSKGQACLRASPLVKTFGWALHHDAQGRIALVDPASTQFGVLMAQSDVTKLWGMRSKRA
jgi:hypothetical protein